MKKLLNENLLKSDFTFGFELEACAEGYAYSQYQNEYDETMDDEKYDLDPDDSYEVTGELAQAIDNSLNDLLNTGVPEKMKKYGNIDNDPSVETEEYDDYTFEWASPVLECTPYNFNRVINMLYNLDRIGVYTNKSCGFHHHLSYKGITERDMIWIYVNLCMDTDFRDYMSSVDGINLTSQRWSPDDELNDIKYSIENDNFSRVLYYLSDDKYRLFRIHPYGTIEWRGPRNFLNDGNLQVIKDFYKKFNTYISKVIEYQARKTILNTDIDKKTFFDKLTKAKEENPSQDRELEFLVRTHGYHDRPLQYKTERGAVISKRLLGAFTQNPEIFYNFVMEEKKGLIPIIKNQYNLIRHVVDSLYDMGIANEEQFATKLYELSSIAFPDDIDMVMHVLSNFKKFINESVLFKIIENNMNGDINKSIHAINSIISKEIDAIGFNVENKSRQIIPFKILYNCLVKCYNSNYNLREGFLTSILYYIKNISYTNEQKFKILMFVIKYGYKKERKPFTNVKVVLELLQNTLKENEINQWNYKMIAALFEKPYCTWLAPLIIDNNNLDIKGLIALCSINRNIYANLNNSVSKKISDYIED